MLFKELGQGSNAQLQVAARFTSGFVQLFGAGSVWFEDIVQFFLRSWTSKELLLVRNNMVFNPQINGMKGGTRITISHGCHRIRKFRRQAVRTV